VITRHAPPWMGLSHVYAEIRPDTAVVTRPAGWRNPKTGEPLEEKRAKYLFPPNRKKRIARTDDHDQRFVGRPEDRVRHVERKHGGHDVYGPHQAPRSSSSQQALQTLLEVPVTLEQVMVATGRTRARSTFRPSKSLAGSSRSPRCSAHSRAAPRSAAPATRPRRRPWTRGWTRWPTTAPQAAGPRRTLRRADARSGVPGRAGRAQGAASGSERSAGRGPQQHLGEVAAKREGQGVEDAELVDTLDAGEVVLNQATLATKAAAGKIVEENQDRATGLATRHAHLFTEALNATAEQTDELVDEVDLEDEYDEPEREEFGDDGYYTDEAGMVWRNDDGHFPRSHRRTRTPQRNTTRSESGPLGSTSGGVPLTRPTGLMSPSGTRPGRRGKPRLRSRTLSLRLKLRSSGRSRNDRFRSTNAASAAWTSHRWPRSTNTF
jgi:hypothetical protein